MKKAMFLLSLIVCLAGLTAWAQDGEGTTTGPVYVSDPVVPTLTPAFRDLPDYVQDPNTFGMEMKRREDWGFTPVEYDHPPQVDPLLQIQRDSEKNSSEKTDAGFQTLIHNYDGQSSTSSPPDTTGDVGPTYFVQATNQSVSTVAFINKTTGAFTTKALDTLTTASPCKSGYCDPIVVYDRVADRWILSELPSSGGYVCVYVSQTGDPTGAYYAYAFNVESSLPDYPKYGVWPTDVNGGQGSYLLGVNFSSTSGYWDIFALDRGKMLTGATATFQKFQVPYLANAGFQLVIPSHMEGSIPPPTAEPGIFARPHDDENADSPAGNTPTYDWIDLFALSVNWTTPASSTLTTLTAPHIADYDMTLCGMGSTWNCMPQPGTTQKIDPIREPLHWPLHYRNFSDHQAMVGTFVEDVDGTDHAAIRWFELRKPESGGSWTLYQEGVIGGEAGVHRSVGSISIDSSSNIAIGYTRTGSSTPYYPSIYYKGRLSSDTLGTMPQGEYTIIDGLYSKTADERWGDYSGMATDPSDDCTFWYTTEYMYSTSNNPHTKVAAFKFSACGCTVAPGAPVVTAVTDVDACASSGVSVTYTAGSGASSHNLLKDGTVVVTGYNSGTAYVPGDNSSHTYTVQAVNGCGTTPSASGMAGTDVNNGAGTPVITAVTDVTSCAASGVSVVYTAGSGATNHNLLKDGTLVVTGYTSGATYVPGDTSSHTYIVQAVLGACNTNSAGMAGTDTNIGPGTPAISTVADVNACAQSGVQVNYTPGLVCSAQAAAYNATTKTPACTANGISCDSGTALLKCSNTGESNYPNTVNSACADGTAGTTANCDATTGGGSVDQITVSGGSTCMAVGSAVTITAKFYCRNTTDYHSIWYATSVPASGDATWTNIGASTACSASGVVTRTLTTTLGGSVGLQAIRAEIAIGAASTSCATTSSGRYDHDDLVFMVAAAPTSYNLLKDGTTVVTGYASGATYNPGDTASHTYVVRAVSGSCSNDSTGVAGTDASGAPGAPSISAVSDLNACASTGITVSYTAGSNATSHNLLKDSVVVVTGYTSGATYTPGDANSHTYTVQAVNTCGNTNSTGVAGADANNTPGAPSITGITDNNVCVQDGVKVNFTAGSGATSHNLYKDGSVVVTGYTSGTLYNPGDTATHTYKIRAIAGACTTDSGTSAFVDAAGPCSPPAEDAPGNTSSNAQSWTSTSTQSWPPVSGATSYTLYRGTPGQLPNLLNTGTDSCTVYSGASTNATDAHTPAAGAFYWYLVTASNSSGEGPAGNATGAVPRIVNSTGSCPP